MYMTETQKKTTKKVMKTNQKVPIQARNPGPQVRKLGHCKSGPNTDLNTLEARPVYTTIQNHPVQNTIMTFGVSELQFRPMGEKWHFSGTFWWVFITFFAPTSSLCTYKSISAKKSVQ